MNNRSTLEENARVCASQVHPRGLVAYNCVSIEEETNDAKDEDYYYYYYHYSRKEEAERGAQPNSSAKINRVRGWKKKEREERRKDFWHVPRDALPIAINRNLATLRCSLCYTLFRKFCVELGVQSKRNRYEEESRFFCRSLSPPTRTKVPDRERLKIEFKEWQSFLTSAVRDKLNIPITIDRYGIEPETRQTFRHFFTSSPFLLIFFEFFDFLIACQYPRRRIENIRATKQRGSITRS